MGEHKFSYRTELTKLVYDVGKACVSRFRIKRVISCTAVLRRADYPWQRCWWFLRWWAWRATRSGAK